MLSYRHGFHAGNWADVHKHAALALLLAHLKQKDKPFTVVDPFAGDAVYDLTSPEALKTGEFRDGIARIWRRTDAPDGVAWYLAQVRALNAKPRLATYPGSPVLARAALRRADRLIAGELHPTAYAALKRWAKGDPRIAVHRRDGFELLGAIVPPPAPRGLVLIDPSYEVKSEYDTLAPALVQALGKWTHGIYAVWYPILREGRHRSLLAALARLPADGMLVSELAPPSPPPTGLQGSGLTIVNPPWRFEADMEDAGRWIAAALWGPRAGRHELSAIKLIRPDEINAKSPS
jgi:23S rRNA (adenine2030-N6)-methyltransferase